MQLMRPEPNHFADLRQYGAANKTFVYQKNILFRKCPIARMLATKTPCLLYRSIATLDIGATVALMLRFNVTKS